VGSPDDESVFDPEAQTWTRTGFEVWLRTNREQATVTREKLEAACWGIACDELGLPHDIKFKEYRDDPAGGPKLRIWQNPDGTEMADQAVDKAFCDRQEHLRTVLGWDGGLTTISIPPSIPSSLKVAILKSPARSQTCENWRWVGHEESKGIPVPLDPLRVKHDKTFRGLFQKVASTTGLEFSPRDIANRYYDDPTNSQPWFQFTIHDCKFTVGPRKRVIELQVETGPLRLLPTEGLAALAVRDSVTYEADGKWKSEALSAKTVLIHAWNTERAVEYLTAMVKAATPGSSPAVSE
jgi:hypothetical protein